MGQLLVNENEQLDSISPENQATTQLKTAEKLRKAAAARNSSDEVEHHLEKSRTNYDENRVLMLRVMRLLVVPVLMGLFVWYMLELVD